MCVSICIVSQVVCEGGFFKYSFHWRIGSRMFSFKFMSTLWKATHTEEQLMTTILDAGCADLNVFPLFTFDQFISMPRTTFALHSSHLQRVCDSYGQIICVLQASNKRVSFFKQLIDRCFWVHII